jgi:hypothetical protein
MKTKVLILALVVVAALTASSCTSSKSGCNATSKYMGYR